MNAKKIGLVILIGVVGFFAIGFTWVYLWETLYPEDYAQFQEEQERKEQRKQEIDRAIQNLEPFPSSNYETKEELDYYNQEMKKIRDAQEKERQKQQELRTVQRDFPASCDGVMSADVTLYPNAAQCMEDLALGFYDYCYADLQDKDLAQACASRGVMRVYENCEDNVLSIPEDVCVMREMRNAYLLLAP